MHVNAYNSSTARSSQLAAYYDVCSQTFIWRDYAVALSKVKTSHKEPQSVLVDKHYLMILNLCLQVICGTLYLEIGTTVDVYTVYFNLTSEYLRRL